MCNNEDKKIKVNIHELMMYGGATDDNAQEVIEREMSKLKKMKCCICGEPFDQLYGTHNPYPVRPTCYDYWSKDGRCCTKCNDTYVASFRRIRFTEDKLYKKMAKMLAKCKTLDEIHDFAEANDFKIYDFTANHANAIDVEKFQKDGESIGDTFMRLLKEQQGEPLKEVPRPTKK